MPKKILHESATHHFLRAGSRLAAQLTPADAAALSAWLNSLSFDAATPGILTLRWPAPTAGSHALPLAAAHLYTRGDATAHAARQSAAGLPFAGDSVLAANESFFDRELRTALAAAQLPLAPSPAHHVIEKNFHDAWAAAEDLARIDVRRRATACTSPELRLIRQKLGDLRGRTLLDVGCGLGEAAVYFALEGATVTATDLAPGMCAAAQKLAALHHTSLETLAAPAESLSAALGARRFDVIYTGNTLHHADLAATLDALLPHLAPDGVFVSWDPVAYNPLINVYRRLATQVRTPDEHPLRLRDIRAIAARFEHVETSWFWFTTLLIFVLMFAVQFRSPNRERYWKTVVDEADRWAWLYRPLAALDRALLAALPFLRPLCWNVVIVARRPRLPAP